MKYGITKRECQKSIRGVCSRCGGKLEPLETKDNGGNPTFWSGCSDCMCFDNGFSKEIYTIAKILVTEKYYRPYSHFDHDSENSSFDVKRYHLNEQISGACRLVFDVLKIKNKISKFSEVALKN
jgi:hypothetical protein